MTHLKEQEQIRCEFGLKDNLQRSLENQALILKVSGDLNGAMALPKWQEQICCDLGQKAACSIR